MSQPVKISDELIGDARRIAEIAERSIAGQIEFWAQLGRAIEPLLEGSRALALRQAGSAVPLSECLASIDSRPKGAGGSRNTLIRDHFPITILSPTRPACWLEWTPMGRAPLGRFVGREFQAVPCP